MLCPKCGRDVGSKVKICSNCKNVEQLNSPASEDNSKEEISTDNEKIAPQDENNSFDDVPAGFWLRFFATLGDSILIGILNLIFVKLIISTLFNFKFESLTNNIIQLANNRLDNTQVIATIIITAIITLLVTLLLYAILFFIFSLFYNSLFESSNWQATPGKKLIGIYVTNKELKKQSLIQAIKRNLFKILSIIPFGFGYVLAGLTDNKQALHDFLSKSYVIKDTKFNKDRRVYTILAIVVAFIIWSAIQSNINFGVQNKSNFIKRKQAIPTNSYIKARGYIGDENFSPNSAYISEQGILTFREGKDFFADRKISLFLFKKIGEIENKSFQVTGKEFGNPHVHISWKISDDKLPKTVILTSEYLLNLNFEVIRNGKIKGRIDLKAGGEKETSFVGEFEATLR